MKEVNVLVCFEGGTDEEIITLSRVPNIGEKVLFGELSVMVTDVTHHKGDMKLDASIKVTKVPAL